MDQVTQHLDQTLVVELGSFQTEPLGPTQGFLDARPACRNDPGRSVPRVQPGKGLAKGFFELQDRLGHGPPDRSAG
jgi:hypothetical protein